MYLLHVNTNTNATSYRKIKCLLSNKSYRLGNKIKLLALEWRRSDYSGVGTEFLYYTRADPKVPKLSR
jgi:hypothetical protein